MALTLPQADTEKQRLINDEAAEGGQLPILEADIRNTMGLAMNRGFLSRFLDFTFGEVQ